MKKSILVSLLVIVLSMMLAAVSSFAADNPEKKTVNGTDDKTVAKDLKESQATDEFKSELEGFVKKEVKASSDFRGKSYYDPVTDDVDDPYIEVYYPEPWRMFCRGNNMYVDYSVYDTWEDYYTLPVTAIFDEYDNIIDIVEGDVAYVNRWTNYTGARYINPSKYSPGFYYFVILNVPCYSSGYAVDGWSEWTNIPMATVWFEVCNHSFSSWSTTKKATEVSTGQRSHKCYYCGKVENQTIKALNPTLPAVSIKKPAAAKKSATVKWKKVSKKNQKKIASIQIQYSTDKKFSKGVKTVTAKKSATSKKIKGLTSKKTYYVRIRAYKKDSKGVHISKWSSIKSVKAK